MEDISLHIMDIVENSIAGGATIVTVATCESKNSLCISIADNGAGMSSEQMRNAADPFYTTKSGKRFGLGLSLFKQAAEETAGNFSVESEQDRGTIIKAEFITTHPDMKPVGEIEETVRLLGVYHPEITFKFESEPIPSHGGMK